jgi:biotin carboxylase
VVRLEPGLVGGPPSHSGARALVLGAGPGQRGLLRAARRLGVFVVACDRDPEAFGFAYADLSVVVSTEDEAGIERAARDEAVGGIVAPGIDWPVAIAARVAARLGLPHPIDPETAARAVSKRAQRELFDERGVPQPDWRIVASPEAAAGAPLPCVVKPPDRQGQHGISVVTASSELPAAVEDAIAASRSGEALVEELVDGPEVTVNAFSVDGRFHPLTVTDRVTADPPAFGVALAHVWPSEAAGEEAVEVAHRAAEAVGVRNGPTYTQLRIGPDGPKVMELAARLGGGHDADLCEAALGIDLNGLALAAALGEPLDVPPADPVGGACVLFLVAPEGRLRAVEGLDEAREEAGVLDAFVYRSAGWRYGPLRRGGDRAGFVLARGESREAALAAAERAAGRIRFDVDAEDQI